MNLGGIYKAGFYPYPPQALALTLPRITAPAGASVRLLDPCAGEGVALAAVTNHLTSLGAQPDPYAVELADARARKAAGVLPAANVLKADWFDVSLSTASMALLWLNPPYDFDLAGDLQPTKRLEYTFLRSSYDRLMPGGLLVYIVPRWTLGIREVARLLAGHFTGHAVYTVPEYAQHRQVVLFAVRRAKAQPDGVTEALLKGYVTQMPPALDTATETYELPACDLKQRFVCYKNTLTPVEERDLAAAHGVLTTPAWAETARKPQTVEFIPAVPMRRGHVAMLVASGLLGTMTLGDTLARGYAVKVFKDLTKAQGAADEEDADKKVEREQFVTKVFTFDRQGHFGVVETNEALETFLTAHATAIAALIEARHKPLYDTPEAALWQKLGTLLPTKKLPGRAVAGLLDAQKHVALAAAKTIQARGHANVVADMGFGKSGVALATAHTLDAWPALVLCPPHLVEKWVREVADVVPGATSHIITSVKDAADLAATYRPGQPVVAILSREDAKLGSGWRPATLVRQQKRVAEDGWPHWQTMHTCPRCGQIVTDADGVPLAAMPPRRLFCQGARRDPQPGDLQKRAPCNEPLYQYTRYNDKATSKARWPIARYIREQLPGFFALLVTDELHQYKGKGTDQAAAFQDLVVACRNTLTLTGTIFGGKSVDLFRLLYRLDRQVRVAYRFHDENRWSVRYGRLERTTKKYTYDAAGRSGNTRYFERVREIPGVSPLIVERVLPTLIFARIADLGYALPPLTESVVRLEMTPAQATQYNWLDRTLLELSKAAKAAGDLGLLAVWLQNVLARPNSGFREETVVRGLGGTGQKRVVVPVMAPQDGELTPIVLPPMLPAETGWLPKEAWLAAFVQSEIAQGRKVLVYARQTGTRDIQPRLQAALQCIGVRPLALPDSVDARKREAWINANMPSLDVLITNPRKVETGLDLVQFATVVFYEIEYSLPSFWQAMRRVWRLGQTQPVKVVYAVYKGTLEEAGLALMGQKFKAAAMLYGDSAASAISDEADDNGGDFLAELAARVLAGERLSTDGLTGLLGGSASTGDAWGSYTQPSPELPWIMEFLIRAGVASNTPLAQIVPPKPRRRVYLPPPEQGRLFDA
jgi:SAM-dependent methyltransferase